ncbi:hypothetical protein CUV01_04100 [Paracoccus tegillarcae]|uniref:Uncharacterized protein n=1 Tax=Paracoccus tegillarcae TaxID=1529068 RepID=A0A2K9ECM3_9RHOB|nr:hypothetical protein CUV01_04100 [Paracoccus tegillarcae]
MKNLLGKIKWHLKYQFKDVACHLAPITLRLIVAVLPRLCADNLAATKRPGLQFKHRFGNPIEA